MASGSSYPSSLDTFTDKISGDYFTVSDANTHASAIENIEAELGTDPAGGYADVAARLDDLPFAGEDSAYDSVNVRLGIGIAAPGYEIHVRKDDDVFIGATAIGTSVESNFLLQRARGSAGSESAVQSGDILGDLQCQAWGSNYQDAALIRVTATENWDGTNNGSQIEFYTNAIGGNTPAMMATMRNGYGLALSAGTAVLTLGEESSTPSDPNDGTQTRIYMKSDKLVIQYNDGGTVRYKYLDLTGTGATWTHTTSAP